MNKFRFDTTIYSIQSIDFKFEKKIENNDRVWKIW